MPLVDKIIHKVEQKISQKQQNQGQPPAYQYQPQGYQGYGGPPPQTQNQPFHAHGLVNSAHNAPRPGEPGCYGTQDGFTGGGLLGEMMHGGNGGGMGGHQRKHSSGRPHSGSHGHGHLGGLEVGPQGAVGGPGAPQGGFGGPQGGYGGGSGGPEGPGHHGGGGHHGGPGRF